MLTIAKRAFNGRQGRGRGSAIGQRSAFVDFSSVPKRHDHHEEDVVLHGVDDAVVTDPNPQTWAALQRPGRWRSWVLREQSNRALDAPADLGVELAKRPGCGRPELDAIRAHVQPRSALACSQGMFGPPSSMAASKAATSCASSSAVISSS